MAKFKVGQRVKIDRKDATITKTNAEGHWDYYYFKFDGDPRERGIHESEIFANSSVCNSSNPVVRKAMNAKVSMNSVDAKDKEEMAKFFKLMNDTISEISRLDMEFASYIKGLLNKAEKTQDNDLADWLQKANLEWKNLKIKGKIMR